MNQLCSRLLQPVSDADTIKILKRNVREIVGKIIYPMTIASVEQLRLECNEPERNFPRGEFHPIPQPTRSRPQQVNEMYVESDEYLYIN